MSLVSIIVPNYNNSSFLKQSIKSCLSQSQAVLKEIIIVDDHSNDGSWSIIKKHEERYPNLIKAFKNPGKGACSARNFGFEQARGKYIQFLDSDDLLSKNKIEAQIKILRNNVDSVASCLWMHFEDTPQELIPPKLQPVDKDFDNPLEWLIDSWTGGGMGQTAIWLTPRPIIEKAGGWNIKLKKNQDGEFFCRILLRSKCIRFAPDETVYYRKPLSTNVSQQHTYVAASSLLESYRICARHILAAENSGRVKLACAQNFLGFIYQYHPQYEDLLNKAWQYYKELQVKSPFLLGGKNFQMVSKFIGFQNTLYLRKILKKRRIL